MPLDPSIVRHFKPTYELPDPLDQQHKMLTLAGLLQQQQERQRQAQQMQEYRAGLRPDMTDEQRVAHAARYVTDPKDVLHYAGQQLVARATREQSAQQFLLNLAERQEARAQKHREFQQSQADKNAKDAEMLAFRRDQLAFQEQNAAALRMLAQEGLDLRRLGLAQVNKPPQGYRWTADGNLERIPGGPPDENARLAARKEALRQEGAMRRADIVIKKVDEAMSQTGFWTTGLIGDIRSTLPGRLTGSGAYDLDKTIDTIKANIGFKELQEMKEASPTGGALGQIAVRELELLQSVVASIDKGQDRALLIKNLKQVKTHFENWKKAVQMANEQQPTPTPTSDGWSIRPKGE